MPGTLSAHNTSKKPLRYLWVGGEFAISCGTVTIDIARRDVLALHYKLKSEYFLPKGRKDIGEGLEETCLRETLEEAGVRATLFNHLSTTQATLSSKQTPSNPSTKHTEPIAVTERQGEDGTWKMIFWFIAEADSSLEPERRDEQDSHDFDPVWIPVDEIMQWNLYRDELEIVSTAIRIVYNDYEEQKQQRE